MEQATQDILQSVLGDEFKKVLDKKDKILTSLDSQIKKMQENLASLEESYKQLSIRRSALQDEIIQAYLDKDEAIKKDRDSFEQSKKATVDSLNSREMALDHYEQQNDDNIKKHLDNLQIFDRDKSEFEKHKKAIADTLLEAFNAHSLLFKDAIDALNSPIEEAEKKDSEEK